MYGSIDIYSMCWYIQPAACMHRGNIGKFCKNKAASILHETTSVE